MPFTEINTYQIKPEKVTEFESIMKEATNMMRQIEGCQCLRLIKRTHHIKEMKTIKEGLPPHEITRIVKCMRYALYWEFDNEINYGKAQKQLYETFWKSINKCLLIPHNKFLGEVII